VIVALGMALVIGTEGIDLSVGSVMALAAALIPLYLGYGVVAAIVVSLLAGVVVGLINGVLVAKVGLQPIVATLALFVGGRGLAVVISGGQLKDIHDPDFIRLGSGDLFGIPILVWVLIIVALATHLMLRYTDIGRNIYAIGGNPTAARLAGIDINRYVVGCYVLAGFVAAIAGILLTARTGSGQPTSGSQGLELQSITAAALGGVALLGGKGGISGTVIAVILLGVLQNGLTILDVNSFWQDIAQGALLVVAVVVQQRRRGLRAYGLPR